MSTSPPDRTQSWWAALTSVVVSGVTYAAVSEGNATWGYKIHEEAVTGSNIPYLGTGVFHGDVQFKGIGSPTDRWDNIVTVTSGVATTFGVKVRFGDTTGTSSGARTWTYSGKFSEYKQSWSKDGAVMFDIKAILGSEPVAVQS